MSDNQGHVLGEPSDFGWVTCHRCEYVFDDWGVDRPCDGPLPIKCHRPNCEYHAQEEYVI